MLCPLDFPGKNTGMGCHSAYSIAYHSSHTQDVESLLSLSMGYLSDRFQLLNIQQVVPVLDKALSCPAAPTSYFLNAQCKKYIFPEITRLSGSRAKWRDPGGWDAIWRRRPCSTEEAECVTEGAASDELLHPQPYQLRPHGSETNPLAKFSLNFWPTDSWAKYSGQLNLVCNGLHF